MRLFKRLIIGFLHGNQIALLMLDIEVYFAVRACLARQLAVKVEFRARQRNFGGTFAVEDLEYDQIVSLHEVVDALGGISHLDSLNYRLIVRHLHGNGI